MAARRNKLVAPSATPTADPFYAGRIRIKTIEYALIVAPKALGEIADGPWNKSTKAVDGATSFFDGLANTLAMAEAGSKLAKAVLALSIDGQTDWYLPALDELEICYRNFKPTTDDNSPYGRSGINVSAVPPTYPYAVAEPAQTSNVLFRAGAAEAFDAVYYWSSTQHASFTGTAWYQLFLNGTQDLWHKVISFRARTVRRVPL